MGVLGAARGGEGAWNADIVAGGRRRCCSRTRVSGNIMALFPALRLRCTGARHLYLLDFDGTNLPDLKSTIEGKYPDVKVCAELCKTLG